MLHDEEGSAVRPVLTLLASDSLPVRRFALELLGELGTEARSVLPRILEAAAEPGLGNGLRVLGRIGGASAVPTLERALAQGDGWAADGLIYVGPEAVPAIMRVLQARETPGPTRELAWLTLEEATSPSRGHWECDYREGPCPPRARAEAARVAAVAPLTQLAMSPESPLDMRRRSLRLLREYGEVVKPVLPLLRALQASGPLRPDALALEGATDEVDTLLGWIGGNAEEDALSRIAESGAAAAPALPRLLALYEQADLVRRTPIAETLGWIGDPRAVPILLEALEAPSVRLAASAALALGRIGDRTTVLPLTRKSHEHWAAPVRQAASEALQMISQGGFDPHSVRDYMVSSARAHLRELVNGTQQCSRPCPPRGDGWTVSPWWIWDRIPELASVRTVRTPKGFPYPSLPSGLFETREVADGWLLGWGYEDQLGGLWFVTHDGVSHELARTFFRGFAETPTGLVALTSSSEQEYGTYGPVLRLIQQKGAWRAEPVAELPRDPAAWRLGSDGALNIFHWSVPAVLTPSGELAGGTCP